MAPVLIEGDRGAGLVFPPMRLRPALLLSAIALVAVGCGSGEPATPIAKADDTTPAAAETVEGLVLSDKNFTDQTGEDAVEVTARDNVFIKAYLEVSPGTEVTFVNKGEQGHNVFPAVDGAFPAIESDNFLPGEKGDYASGTITFDEPGDYAYYCTLHGTKTKGMVGAIRVLES